MKKVYLKSFGCQMNENDSMQVIDLLKARDYVETANPQEADLIVINTCSVREKSYQKAMSEIGRQYKRNRSSDSVKIGIMGCVASQEKDAIIQRFPFVDFVLGTDQIDKINEALDYSRLQDGAFVAADFQEIKDYHFPAIDISHRDKAAKAYVTIMKGCDNTCSFCIVPFTRGKEVSRAPQEIIEEIKFLEQRGVQEITLLGQNVNSYGKRLARKMNFADLIKMIESETTIKRLRFTSPHPKDLSHELIEQYKESAILCNHIHLPVQSGSSRVLKRMRRAHTRETYLQRIADFKKECPNAAITTDIIVGFPGESDEDFAETLSLVRSVDYDASYSFSYSERPHTEAAQFKDDVPDDVKWQRLQDLQALQREISLARNQRLVGRIEDVLVEGPSKLGRGQFTGRTSSNKVFNFNASLTEIGSIIPVKIHMVSPYALYGEMIHAS
jgi:tRNA-2-methylthio-N6-dimethylallyladenosine synthase